jgi:glutathione gamma-glutamylcysteinyltransferase
VTRQVRVLASAPRAASAQIINTTMHHRRSLSSAVPVERWDDHTLPPPPKHCNTCTCDENDTNAGGTTDADSSFSSLETKTPKLYPCGNPQHEDDHGALPPPLPEPAYSVHMRVLPKSLIALSSPDGRRYLQDALQANTAESYWALTEQFVNQSDPAFCGVTTLLMVLNAMCVDPQIRWRGGWRYYGSEDVLLDRCCLSNERIRRVGVTLEEFRLLGRCHSLSVELKRPSSSSSSSSSSIIKERDGIYSVDDFRADIRRILTQTQGNPMLVVSFSRPALGQTGEGHFSPLAAYHADSDHVLLLDVARFKYAPYWVSVDDLYESMIPEDAVTSKPRGWFVLHPPKHNQHYEGPSKVREDRRPAELVPRVGDGDACPVGKVKVDFCAANRNGRSS